MCGRWGVWGAPASFLQSLCSPLCGPLVTPARDTHWGGARGQQTCNCPFPGGQTGKVEKGDGRKLCETESGRHLTELLLDK